MGRCHVYECARCLYTVMVSGGADGGRDCFTQTMQCLDCRELFDVVTHVRRRAARMEAMTVAKSDLPARSLHGLSLPEHAAVPRRILRPRVELPDRVLKEAARMGWVELEASCPRGPLHRLEPWTEPGKCPRCGTFLERTLMPFRMWD